MIVPCIDAPPPYDAGYKRVRYRGKYLYLHRLVYAQAKGLDVLTMAGAVMHSCDRPCCVQPAHLSLGTRGLNNQDRSRKGRSTRIWGAQHASAKLTEQDVVAIRNTYVPNCRTNGGAALGRRYGVTQAHVSLIITRQTWIPTNERDGA